jgi:hypothetical protein
MHEPAGSLMQPDFVLPEQYFAAPRPPSLSPERRLMLAVLEEAVLTVLKYRHDHGAQGRRVLRDAEHWIEERDASWPFSFESICAALYLNADYVRRGLLALIRRPTEVAAGRPTVSPFARRVAGRRHKVGLLVPHRKMAR